jgi:pimeloyl-ACP methyl ester carboxylesterase
MAVAGLFAWPHSAAAGGSPTVPVLNWQPCTPAQAGFDCATAKVPLDYSAPQGQTINLGLIRHKATDQANRIGSLFWNAGGPGAAGTVFLPIVLTLPATGSPVLFPEALHERFDIISWDPRGIGAPPNGSNTTSVQCFGSPQEEADYEAKLPAGVPVTPEQRQAWIDGWAYIAQTCANSSSAYLLSHVSTADTARDLDLLRQAVGDAQLTYQGNSYGTFLGTVYANLFPDKVRAMMFLGNVDPTAWTNDGDDNPTLDVALRQNAEQGTAKTLDAFLNFCGQSSVDQCAFSAGSPAATRAKWRSLAQRLLTTPVIVGDVTYNYDLVVTTVVDSIYQVPGWPTLANTLEALWEGSMDPSRYPPNEPSVQGQQSVQVLAVKCAEAPNPHDPDAYYGLADLATKRAGIVGPYWVWLDEQCAAWRATATDQYTGPWNHPTANPILLINNTVDPATPYSEAIALSQLLANARLLTIRGYGHADGGDPSTCANTYVSDYFINLALPPKGAVCRQDNAPFISTSVSE